MGRLLNKAPGYRGSKRGAGRLGAHPPNHARSLLFQAASASKPFLVLCFSFGMSSLRSSHWPNILLFARIPPPVSGTTRSLSGALQHWALFRTQTASLLTVADLLSSRERLIQESDSLSSNPVQLKVCYITDSPSTLTIWLPSSMRVGTADVECLLDSRSWAWRGKWQLTPVFLLGKSHWQRSLVGYSPRGHRSWTHLSDQATTTTRPWAKLFAWTSVL